MRAFGFLSFGHYGGNPAQGGKIGRASCRERV